MLGLVPVQMENRIFIGIDPGVKGGVAFIYNDLYFAKPTPPTVQEMSAMIHKMIDMAPDIAKYAIIERVHSMPKQGVASTFKFGMNYGQWLGILATLGIPYIQVTPYTWMSYFGSMPKDKKDRKNHIKHLAQQRYPNTKITLGTSDAMLMCHYLMENNKQ